VNEPSRHFAATQQYASNQLSTIYVRSSIEIVETSRQGAHQKERNSGCLPRRGTVLANTMGLPHAGQAGGLCGVNSLEDALMGRRDVNFGLNSLRRALSPTQHPRENDERDHDREQHDGGLH
jgi:hypothetical protein